MMSSSRVLLFLLLTVCSGGSNSFSFGFVARRNCHRHQQPLLPKAQLNTDRPSRFGLSLLPNDTEGSGGQSSSLVGDIASIEIAEFDERLWYAVPPIATFTAFHTYGATSKAFHGLVELLSGNTWVPADGGKYAASIITPALNGPVIASIAILFGTLVSVTVSALYERQEKIRLDLATELETLRYLQQIVQGFPNKEQRLEAQSYVNKYTDQLFGSLTAKEITADLVFANGALGDLVALLNRMTVLAENPDSDDSNNNNNNIIVPVNLVERCYNCVENINSVRASKVNLYLSAFPPIHYLLLSSLAFCICGAFLVETDQELLFFLTGFQLKLVWACLIGVFTSMAVVLIDLVDPFTGPYAITDFNEETLVGFLSYAKNKNGQQQ